MLRLSNNILLETSHIPKAANDEKVSFALSQQQLLLENISISITNIWGSCYLVHLLHSAISVNPR